MPRLLRALALAALFLSVSAIAAATHDAWPGRTEAARSDWNAQTPPQSGWIEVTLPDDWSVRWPQFDGVVWYRLSWTQSEPVTDTGLFIDYLNMAGVIRVNGTVLAEDRNLVEPLSRMWNQPRYFRLAAPLLHAGENTLLVRVSGLAPYQPGLGVVHLGAPGAMRDASEQARWLRLDIPLFYLALCLTIGSFFFVLWLLRRQESAYGWYALVQLSWAVFESNQVLTSTGPFATTSGYKAVIGSALLVTCAASIMFALRYCGRRWPRRELLLWCVTALGIVGLFAAPHAWLRAREDLLVLFAMAMGILGSLLFLRFAWSRGGSTDQRVLATGEAFKLAAECHDGLAVMRVIDSTTYYVSIVNQIDVVLVSVVLAWTFVRNVRRVEGFNVELQRNVDEARAELATTLSRQHQLELVHARLGERVSLAHDLHDGLGGMLIGNIAALEQAPEQMPSREALDMFRELRDDLRLIIDTASAQQHGEHSLDHLLGPLRHRMTRLFDARDIELHWNLSNLENVYLTTTQSLDILRILQEALANALKHSGASRVSIELRRSGDALQLEVSDNGVGMTPPTSADDSGTGMRSMHARAQRLGATLTIGSEPGATVVRLFMNRAGLSQ